MLIIGVIIFLLLAVGGFNVVRITKTIANDPRLHNNLGVIRGSIQRLVKLELSHKNSDELIKDIDEKIQEFTIHLSNSNSSYKETLLEMERLNVSWSGLKDLIYENRGNFSTENKIKLLNKSEDIWEKANDTVLASQKATEKMMRSFKISIIFFLTNLILTGIMLLFIKKYIQDTLEQMINKDGLTQIYNRRYFDEYLTFEVMKGSRNNGELCLIMFDIDNFKRVNDEHGHSIGDYVLKTLAYIVCNNIRKTDVFSRVGGEEFAIITTDTDIQGAYILSEKIRKTIERHLFKKVGRITISLGITQYHKNDTIDDIYKRADEALYKAKETGRNRTEIINHSQLEKT